MMMHDNDNDENDDENDENVNVLFFAKSPWVATSTTKAVLCDLENDDDGMRMIMRIKRISMSCSWPSPRGLQPTQRTLACETLKIMMMMKKDNDNNDDEDYEDNKVPACGHQHNKR